MPDPFVSLQRLQQRRKAVTLQSDEHYLTVLRYLERNPLRANLVERSQDWESSNLKPSASLSGLGIRSM